MPAPTFSGHWAMRGPFDRFAVQDRHSAGASPRTHVRTRHNTVRRQLSNVAVTQRVQTTSTARRPDRERVSQPIDRLRLCRGKITTKLKTETVPKRCL